MHEDAEGYTEQNALLPEMVSEKGAIMGKFEANKGDTLWTLWADLFLLWREHGKVLTKADADDWYKAAVALDSKYKSTTEADLARKLTISMGEVIDERWEKRNQKE